MNTTSHVSIEKSPHHKNSYKARVFLEPAASGYPKLYLEIHYKVDSKTGLVNPATRDTDFRVLVSPYGYNMSEEFNAPSHGVEKQVHGPIVGFSFVYTVNFGKTEVEVSIKEFLTLKKEVTINKGAVLVWGDFNTQHGSSTIHSDKR